MTWGPIQSLLGCEWGRTVHTPDDTTPCLRQAVQIVVVHEGDSSVDLRLCASHVRRLGQETTPRTDEAGSITFWLLGLFIAVLCMAGLVIDLSRIVAADRALATATDAAAAAGANGIDQAHYRATNEVRLDGSARTLATDAMNAQPEAAALSDFGVVVAPDQVTVSAAMPVPLSLLRLVMTHDPVVYATATASPRRAS